MWVFDETCSSQAATLKPLSLRQKGLALTTIFLVILQEEVKSCVMVGRLIPFLLPRLSAERSKYSMLYLDSFPFSTALEARNCVSVKGPYMRVGGKEGGESRTQIDAWGTTSSSPFINGIVFPSKKFISSFMTVDACCIYVGAPKIYTMWAISSNMNPTTTERTRRSSACPG